jgi:dTDP-4-dehydrorhamnose 3,5-epimerase
MDGKQLGPMGKGNAIMRVQDVNCEDLKIITPDVYEDERGFFFESHNDSNYKKIIGQNYNFVQDNISMSLKNTIRGLHFQVGKPQGKLIQCIKGMIYDVVVDLRKESKTFGEHSWVILSEKNKKQFWIPPGFAHGFMTLDTENIIQYKCTEEYFPLGDRTLMWNDKDINIKWPRCPEPLLSTKDSQGYSFQELIKRKEIFF